jgi:hypothetical protein
MCASKTCSAAIDIPAPTFERRNGFTPIEVMIAFIEAFQEALAMRRATQGKYLRNDE